MNLSNYGAHRRERCPQYIVACSFVVRSSDMKRKKVLESVTGGASPSCLRPTTGSMLNTTCKANWCASCVYARAMCFLLRVLRRGADGFRAHRLTLEKEKARSSAIFFHFFFTTGKKLSLFLPQVTAKNGSLYFPANGWPMYEGRESLKRQQGLAPWPSRHRFYQVCKIGICVHRP